MNNLSIVGRVGKDAEIRKAGSYDVVSFSIAWTNPRGQKNTTWFNVSLFGERFTKLASYIQKGNQIAIEGVVELREYQNKDGETRYSLELNGNNVTLLAGNRGGSSQSGGSDDDDDSSVPF